MCQCFIIRPPFQVVYEHLEQQRSQHTFFQRTPGVTSLYCPIFLFFPYSFCYLPSHYLITKDYTQFNFPKSFETANVWLFFIFWAGVSLLGVLCVCVYYGLSKKSTYIVLVKSPLSNANPVIQTTQADLQGRSSCCRRQLVFPPICVQALILFFIFRS